MAGNPPPSPTRRDCNIAKGGSRTFWFDKGSSVVLGPFLMGDVPLSACHANKGTP